MCYVDLVEQSGPNLPAAVTELSSIGVDGEWYHESCVEARAVNLSKVSVIEIAPLGDRSNPHFSIVTPIWPFVFKCKCVETIKFLKEFCV